MMVFKRKSVTVTNGLRKPTEQTGEILLKKIRDKRIVSEDSKLM